MASVGKAPVAGRFGVRQHSPASRALLAELLATAEVVTEVVVLVAALAVLKAVLVMVVETVETVEMVEMVEVVEVVELVLHMVQDTNMVDRRCWKW